MKQTLRNFRITFAEFLMRNKLLPYRIGADEILDIKKLLPRHNISVIFDVGANHGEVALRLRKAYQNASIHCFEPNSDLRGVIERLSARLNVHSCALGAVVGSIGFDRSKSASDLFSVTDDMSGETVQIDTIDNFCAKNSISTIDYLKIDTEGYDLQVLRGASQMLRLNNVGVVQAEVSMNPENTLHVPFTHIDQFLTGFGYRIFGIYEQVHEFPSDKPNLRRANVAYVSSRLIDLH